jgi:diamine N-acetyltransferase
MNIAIIRADASHAAMIASIGKKSFRNAFEHLFKNREELFEYLEHTYNPVKLVKSIRKENNIYFLAWQNGDPVGFIKVKKHSLNENIESPVQMELQKLYILPEHQGHGIGTALLHEVEQLAHALGPDYIWLDTHVHNERAVRLYEKHGFRKMGKHHFTIGSQIFHYYVMGLPVVRRSRVGLPGGVFQGRV